MLALWYTVSPLSKIKKIKKNYSIISGLPIMQGRGWRREKKEKNSTRKKRGAGKNAQLNENRRC